MASTKRPPVVLVFIAAALLAGIGALLWRYSRFNDVHAVNGLSVPVDVTLAGRTQRVASNAHVAFPDVPVGTHAISAKLEDQELETTLVFVNGSGHTLIYNVGGAAPLFSQRIAYSKTPSTEPPQFKMHCGRRFVVLESIDYVFSDPPATISTKGGDTVYKTHVGVDEGGLATCQSWALDEGTQDMWADWRRLEARLDPDQASAAVDEYAQQGDFREAQVLLEGALAKEPDFTVRSVHQSVLITSGQLEKARELYQRTADDEKATAEDLFLSVKLLPREQRGAFLDVAVTRFPQSSLLRYARALVHDRGGDTEEALPDYALAAVDPPLGFEWPLANQHVAALLRLEQYPEAWAAGQSAFGGPTTFEGAVSLASLAAVTGNPDAGWDTELDPSDRRWTQALLGLPETEAASDEHEPDAFVRARELIRATLQPAEQKTKPATLATAITVAARQSDAVLRLVPDPIVWLLLTEAWRLGDTAAATKLSKHAMHYDAPRLDDALAFIATGRLTLQLDLASDVHLAVLWLARGRRLATLGEDPKASFDEARRLDPYRTVVWRALDTWGPAQPGAKQPWLPVD